ncbi:hypothetical protein VTN96DRAFT_4939 [Rasamsonia emersonii]|uniref:Polyglutamate biosynthesis protein n=1 Tax=Rasamsonia emersonii (strain ATCC 16479 / CBS 393.64 / IMI 116815) TaxID=1408163 RepID=A0A0F4YSN4_RASE3|nr:Polyglutamate biosynthesis protein [Rasamsonia emersonii CBS 393.64]KKA20623.1 Polyglutamate biosynthesis protein [Rasamsonia emersonii CBS 393.64]
MAEMQTAKRTFRLNFLGDVMLGRLIDQLFPQHVYNPEEASIVAAFRQRHPKLQGEYTPAHPWGSTLPLLQQADLNLINLETSATTHDEPWPNKAFNYRMHPANAAAALQRARIDYASLANNHTLDFGPEGLVETAWTLKKARIAFAGAGETTEEAISPAILALPRGERGSREGGQREDPASRPSHTKTSAGGEEQEQKQEDDKQTHAIHVWSASDHPRDWASVPTFHLIDYSASTRSRLKRLLTERPRPEANTASTRPALKIFSVHWGPNYTWEPLSEIRALAHFLIDECDVDIVHGHSSHHVQGVERPRPGKLIIYGCGDFVDDYALTERFRNDLGAVWRVNVREEEEEETNEQSGKRLRLRPSTLEIFPTRIQHFQAHLLDRSDPDHDWVRERITTLTRDLMGSTEIVRPELGDEGQLIVDLE